MSIARSTKLGSTRIPTEMAVVGMELRPKDGEIGLHLRLNARTRTARLPTAFLTSRWILSSSALAATRSKYDLLHSVQQWAKSMAGSARTTTDLQYQLKLWAHQEG